MAAGDSTKLIIELEVLLRNLNRTLRGLDQVKRKLESVANVRVSQRSTAAATERQAIAAQRLAIQQQRLQLQQQRLAVQTQELANRQERARQASERLRRANERLTHSMTAGQRVLREFQSRLNTISAAALRVGGGLRSLGLTVSVALTAPLAALARVASTSAADIDAIRNRLIATEGSVEAANARLTQLRKLADDSAGVTRRTALDTFAVLATLGEVTEDTINKQIRAFGRLNAAFTIDDQQLFFRNLVQIFQQGFEVKDIREALGRVPIFNTLLESAFGTADPEKLRELKAAGKLTLDTFLSGLGTAVETDPILGQVGESIRVRFAKTVERITDALEPLGKAILGPLERIVLAVEPIILRISEAFASLSPNIQTAIVAVGLLVAALGPVLFIVGGLASGLGALGTALATLVPLLGSVGLPAILAILAGVGVLITQIAVGVTVLAQAWRTNFLDIQSTVSRAANGILDWFTRIRAIINDATQRILPTLQSITEKVVNAIQQVWDRYGKFVVDTVGRAFRFILDITETFLKLFTDFVDLVVKLIDGDWRGAWRAFARIVITAIDQLPQLFARLTLTLTRALLGLTAVLNALAVKFVVAAQRIATGFVFTLAAELIKAAPQVRDALTLMLLNAALSVNPTSIVAVLIAKLLAALRKAAEEGIPAQAEATVSVDIGAGAGLFRRKRRGGLATPTTDDSKGAARIAREADRLRDAQDRLAEQEARSRIALARAALQQQFDLAQDGLNRELTALNNNFEDRLVAVRKYFDARRKLEEAQIDSELTRERGLSKALADELIERNRLAKQEFENQLKTINEDKRLKGRARQLAIETAEVKRQTEESAALNDFETQNAEVSTRILVLQKQRADVGEQLARLFREVTDEIEKQKAALQFDLFEEQGLTANAATGRLKQRFRDSIRELRIDTTTLGADLQEALNRVDLTTLQQRLNELPEPIRVLIELLNIGIKRAQIIEAQQLVENLSAQLRLDEERIQNRVLDGLISQREAHKEILARQREYREVLLDILKGELARAKAIKDQGLIVSIQAQIHEVQRLGKEIDTVGQQINQEIFSNLESGIADIFSGARRGIDGIKDALRRLGDTFLDMLNRIAAKGLIEKLEGILKPDSENTQGTIGGFLSKLFGLSPQTNTTTAANTAATNANTAALNVLTTIFGGQTGGGIGGVLAGAAGEREGGKGGGGFLRKVASVLLGGLPETAGAGVIAEGGGDTVISALSSNTESLKELTKSVNALIKVMGGVAPTAATGISDFLSSFLSGGAATGLFPAVPGGVYRVVEGGFPEAVLTTDPKHAARQVAILRAFLRETRGLGGRIRGLAAGGFAMPDLSLNVPSVSLPSGNFSDMEISRAQPINLRNINLFDRREMVHGYMRSAEGTQDLLNLVSEQADEIGRRIKVR